MYMYMYIDSGCSYTVHVCCSDRMYILSNVFQVNTIVNMNGSSFKEGSCAQYWPSRLGEAKYEPFFVTLEEETDENHVTVRSLRLINGAQPNEEAREVKMFTFESWHMYEKVSCLQMHARIPFEQG